MLSLMIPVGTPVKKIINMEISFFLLRRWSLPSINEDYAMSLVIYSSLTNYILLSQVPFFFQLFVVLFHIGGFVSTNLWRQRG